MNEVWVPGAIETNKGVTVMDSNDRSVGLATLRLAVPVNTQELPSVLGRLLPGQVAPKTRGTAMDVVIAVELLSVDLLLNLPGPVRPVGPIVATFASDEVQVARVVKSRVLPSLKRPIAENCNFVPTAIEDVPG